MSKYRLPDPDKFGNFWLDKPAGSPAILKGGAEQKIDDKLILARKPGELKERFLVSTEDGPLLTAKGEIQYFPNPTAALEEFNKIEARKAKHEGKIKVA